MNESQQVFMLFFAIFWGTAANALPRWKAFPWGRYCHCNLDKNRALLSFVLLNAAPILYFIFVLWLLQGKPRNGPEWGLNDMLAVSAGILPAFAAFGLYRVWTSIVQWKSASFYGSPENRKTNEWKESYPGLNATDDLATKYALPNFSFGMLYIWVPVVLAMFLKWVC